MGTCLWACQGRRHAFEINMLDEEPLMTWNGGRALAAWKRVLVTMPKLRL